MIPHRKEDLFSLPDARVKNTREPNYEADDTGCVH